MTSSVPESSLKRNSLPVMRQYPGHWVMFEHFATEGSRGHASGPKMFDVGMELTSQFASPYTRTVLEPVLFAGPGEPITEYPGLGDQSSGDVGVVLIFRVLPGPDRDLEVETAMRALFEAMAAEEFPSGDVNAYGVYRDRCEPGKWVMFEHFTECGSGNHAQGPLMKAAGTGLARLFITPCKRVMLSPMLFVGCGETVSDSSLRQVAPETG